MKELLIALAEYNRGANSRLVALLRNVDIAVLREDQGVFYKSILGTLEHLAGAEISLLKRFGGFFPYPCLDGHSLISEDIAKTRNAIKDKPEVLYTVLAEADDLMVEFARETAEENLPKRVSYVNVKGETIERAYWSMIVHILNHGTHHRGEISALLDRKGIANDLSGFNNYTA